MPQYHEHSAKGSPPCPALPAIRRVVLAKSALHAFPVNANANLMHDELRNVDALGLVFQK